LLLVVGITGCPLVAGITGYSWKKSSAASDVVQQLVTDLKSGDQQAAYGRLSRSYQEAIPQDQFVAWVESHPGLARNTGITRIGFEMGTGGTRVTLLLNASSGERERATFGLVTEGERLKISSIHFEGAATSPQ
jgi:hypothetical protein